jgi:hypothetical protein
LCIAILEASEKKIVNSLFNVECKEERSRNVFLFIFSGDELHGEEQRASNPKELNKSNQIQFHYNDMLGREIIF